jgi:hypothetical protein
MRDREAAQVVVVDDASGRLTCPSRITRSTFSWRLSDGPPPSGCP